jgi:Amt family ammonium transporter
MAAAAGWLGLNTAGAILFAGAGPGKLALIGVNTLLGASSAALVAAITTRIRFGMPDASLTANGWMGGLVATSAGCAFLPPAAAVLTGPVAGIWGLLAAGLSAGSMLAQVVGVATLVGLIFPLTWGLNSLLNRFAPMRVSREGERQGLDLFELGAGAYPDFVTHNDDPMQR